jgi:DNA polymerase-3 subunit gamma/tau
VFENVLGQGAAGRLRDDLEAGRLAPAMLFLGPPASGKGTTALELARVLSCEEESGSIRGKWNCACPSCARHRYLLHQDLLLLGPRRFSAETAAARKGLLGEPESPAASALFVRSIRKLLGRFSPVLWEDDPGFGKFGGLIRSIEENLDEFANTDRKKETLEKLCSSLAADALKLEEGAGETVPVAHVRRAAYWSRLAPSGRMKFILIENADRMQDGARNSLLKILEEPPEKAVIVLTTAVKGAVLATVQSRLRPYRFVQRDEPAEADVIRRIFRGPPGPSVAAYLDSFLPVPDEKLVPAAAFFIASLARGAALELRKRRLPLPPELAALGKYAAAAAAGTGQPVEDSRAVIASVIEYAGNFEGRSFPRFLAAALGLLAKEARGEGVNNPRRIAYNEIWRKASRGAAEAVGTWNQTPALALERMVLEIRGAMVNL